MKFSQEIDDQSNELINQAFEELKSHIYLPPGIELEVPPRSFKELEGRFLEYEPKKKLTGIFPVEDKMLGFNGTMQSGFLTAAFESLFTALAHMTILHPCSTIEISTQNQRPILKGDHIIIETFIEARGQRTIYLSGRAYNKREKLVATAGTNKLIL